MIVTENGALYKFSINTLSIETCNVESLDENLTRIRIPLEVILKMVLTVE